MNITLIMRIWKIGVIHLGMMNIMQRYMGNESGEWIMHGMKWDNPDCIHSVDEAIKYINEFGFLPLLIDSNRWFLCNNGGD